MKSDQQPSKDVFSMDLTFETSMYCLELTVKGDSKFTIDRSGVDPISDIDRIRRHEKLSEILVKAIGTWSAEMHLSNDESLG